MSTVQPERKITTNTASAAEDSTSAAAITMPEEYSRPLTESRWEELDRQDRHLWLLATVLIAILGVSLLSFMIPSAFWFGREMPLAAPERAFFGLCVLLGLALAYLLERQATVRRLRMKLYEARTAAAEAERKAVCQGFLTLPHRDQFRDALAMEYRRASTSGAPLATMLYCAPKASTETMGRLTDVLRHMLRRGENLYRISATAVGIIFPGMQSNDVRSFAAQAAKLSGIPQPGQEITTAAYPDEATSLTELEERLSTESTRVHNYALSNLHSHEKQTCEHQNTSVRSKALWI